MTEVAGRTAFITGGGNGIGLGIARAFARAGARLALADRDADALASAKAELSGMTAVETMVLDVRDRDAFGRAADDVEAKLGPVSLLCNNAGVSGGAPAGKFTYELWDWSLGINLGGVVNGVTTFLPRMIARGDGGHVVNTASGAGLIETPRARSIAPAGSASSACPRRCAAHSSRRGSASACSAPARSRPTSSRARMQISPRPSYRTSNGGRSRRAMPRWLRFWPPAARPTRSERWCCSRAGEPPLHPHRPLDAAVP